MPCTLALNTATTTESLAIIGSDGDVIAESSWIGKKDESKSLIPRMQKMLKKGGFGLFDIEKIIAVAGPGPYSALRIGITIANTLAFALKIPIFEISTPVLMRRRLTSEYRALKPILLLHAGGVFVTRSGGGYKKGLFPIHEALDIPQHDLIFFGDMNTHQQAEFEVYKEKNWRFLEEDELRRFGESIASGLPLFTKHVKKMIEPRYWRPPLINRGVSP